MAINGIALTSNVTHKSKLTDTLLVQVALLESDMEYVRVIVGSLSRLSLVAKAWETSWISS